MNLDNDIYNNLERRLWIIERRKIPTERPEVTQKRVTEQLSRFFPNLYAKHKINSQVGGYYNEALPNHKNAIPYLSDFNEVLGIYDKIFYDVKNSSNDSLDIENLLDNVTFSDDDDYFKRGSTLFPLLHFYCNNVAFSIVGLLNQLDYENLNDFTTMDSTDFNNILNFGKSITITSTLDNAEWPMDEFFLKNIRNGFAHSEYNIILPNPLPKTPKEIFNNSEIEFLGTKGIAGKFRIKISDLKNLENLCCEIYNNNPKINPLIKNPNTNISTQDSICGIISPHLDNLQSEQQGYAKLLLGNLSYEVLYLEGLRERSNRENSDALPQQLYIDNSITINSPFQHPKDYTYGKTMEKNVQRYAMLLGEYFKAIDSKDYKAIKTKPGKSEYVPGMIPAFYQIMNMNNSLPKHNKTLNIDARLCSQNVNMKSDLENNISTFCKEKNINKDELIDKIVTMFEYYESKFGELDANEYTHEKCHDIINRLTNNSYDCNRSRMINDDKYASELDEDLKEDMKFLDEFEKFTEKYFNFNKDINHEIFIDPEKSEFFETSISVLGKERDMQIFNSLKSITSETYDNTFKYYNFLRNCLAHGHYTVTSSGPNIQDITFEFVETRPSNNDPIVIKLTAEELESVLYDTAESLNNQLLTKKIQSKHSGFSAYYEEHLAFRKDLKNLAESDDGMEFFMRIIHDNLNFMSNKNVDFDILNNYRNYIMNRMNNMEFNKNTSNVKEINFDNTYGKENVFKKSLKYPVKWGDDEKPFTNTVNEKVVDDYIKKSNDNKSSDNKNVDDDDGLR